MGSMIWNSIVDHIPLWGWLIIFGVPVAAALYFLHPFLIPLWRMLPMWLRVGIMGIGAAILAFLGGRYRGRANAEEEERRRNAEALQKRVEVDSEIRNQSDEDVHKKLNDRWSRD